MKIIIGANIGAILIVCWLYTAAFRAGYRALRHNKTAYGYKLREVLPSLSCVVRGHLPEWGDRAESALHFAVYASTFASFLMVILHLDYLSQKQFFLLGLRENLIWMFTHAVGAIAINIFHCIYALRIRHGEAI